MAKVSVVVPVYNAEQYLKKCLDSLVNQKFDDYELILVNDCSTDASRKIIDEYKNRYEFIAVYENEKNKGLSYTRNYGIQKATGEYILFVDSDDWLIGDKVLNLLYVTAIDKDLDLLRYRINIDNTKLPLADTSDGKTLFMRLVNELSYRWESVRNFVKKELLEAADIRFDEKIYGCEDLVFSTRLILASKRCLEIEDKLYFYYQHPGSITQSHISNRNVDGVLNALNQLYKLFAKEQDYEVAYSILNLIKRASLMCSNILWRMDENLDICSMNSEFLALYNSQFKYGNLINNHVIFENWDRILHEKNVYIYGAGKAYEELWNNTKNRVSYSGILLSKKENIEEWNGLKIYQVDNEIIEKSGLVLICVTGEAQKGIIESLIKNDILNYIVVGKEIV